MQRTKAAQKQHLSFPHSTAISLLPTNQQKHVGKKFILFKKRFLKVTPRGKAFYIKHASAPKKVISA